MNRNKLLLLPALFLTACGVELQNTITLTGPAQGTTYHISYVAGAYANYRTSIDSIFQEIDRSLSTWQPGSLISRINRYEADTVDAHFTAVFTKAMEVAQKTGGLFDPTVAPLVQAYGFGFKHKEKLTPARIDSLRQLIGYQKVSLNGRKLIRQTPGLMLDFNAIAPGYTVDLIAAFLQNKGIANYLIELGGEVRAKGNRQDGSPWTLGIQEPDEDPAAEARLNTRIALDNKALATSGNYKNFYVSEGQKYSHILHPHTGLPARNNLLSATVIAPDCITADAYATACMVLGEKGARQFVQAHPELQLAVYLIYDEAGTTKTWVSPDFPAPGAP
jgi:thiamine biosynthesis lipoprotein